MATSGTYTFNPSIAEIMEEAFERCGLELRTGYDIKTARRSLNYLTLEWANRQINLWRQTYATVTLVAGTATYTLPAETLDVVDGSIRTNAGNATTQADIEIQRMSASTYQSQVNKLAQAKPLQYYIDRTSGAPTVTFWPVPDAVASYVFYYTGLNKIEDAGSSIDYTMGIPTRFIPALTSGLAFHIASKKPSAFALIPMLKARYDMDWQEASEEDRDRTSLMITPSVGYL